MKDTTASTVTDALRSARVRLDSWLVGAFLVLFGVAVSAAMPPISSAVSAAVADATKNGATEPAQRPGVRLHFVGVRALLPNVPSGPDFVPAAPPSAAVVAVNDRIFARPTDLAARVQERGFRARAPPLRSV